jgi:hypothetical protein
MSVALIIRIALFMTRSRYALFQIHTECANLSVTKYCNYSVTIQPNIGVILRNFLLDLKNI